MNPTGSNSSASSPHSAAHRSEGGFQRFPDFILVGQVNLHKSQECAASLAKHIDKQWDFFRINRNGIISSAQLEINRAPERYGAHKDGKPLSVSEWRKLEKDKLLERRRQLAQEELIASSGAGPSGDSLNTRGRSGGRSRSRGRSRNGSNGRGRGRRGKSH